MTLTPERWKRARDVLHEAMEMDEGERSAFLDSQCASDPSLRVELNELLAAEGEIGSKFLEEPALGQATPRTDAGHTVLPSGTKLGPYVVQSLIGAGGMGEVYRARDASLKRDVAIKVLPPSFSRDPDRLRRFQLEAEAAAALNHPNILSIFHIGQQDGSPYIVTELLEGETLRERLRHGALRLRDAIDIAIQTAKGLAAEHEKGIAHRDLKPENLFLGKDGRVKILDFGLAKLVQNPSAESPTDSLGDQTDVGRVLGTAGYMSPEQVRGETADTRSDIFSLGCVLYEMLTGKRAFRKPTAAETMSAILNEDPPAASEIMRNIPPALQRVVHRCLEKAPDHRFQSASDLAFALDALSDSTAAGLGVARETAAKSGSGSWALGPPKLWLAFSAVLLLVSIGLGWWYWKSRPIEKREIQQRQLTATTADNPIFQAAISRDGKYLAYSDKDGISIQDVENGESYRLPGTTGLLSFDWYPDGLRLLVIDDKRDLFTLFALTGEKRKIATEVFNPTVSPDGSQIAFFRERNRHELWIAPTGGREAKVRFTLDKNESFVSNAAWSPDGKSMAYIRQIEGLNNPAVLETRNLENGETRMLLTDDRLALWDGVLWPSSGRILFALQKSYNESDLWGLSLDAGGFAAGKPFRLTNTTGVEVEGLTASADGKRLAIAFGRGSYAVFVANLSNGGDKLEQPQRLTNDYFDSLPDCWTTDSQTLFYSVDRIEQGQTKSSIYKRRISSDSAEVFLTGAESYDAWSLSSDGAWVIATANRRIPGKGSLLRIPFLGGTPETILDLAGIGEAHCATTRYHTCVLSENIGKQVVFTAFDPIRGRKEELTRVEDSSGNLMWSLSPDGGRIAFVQNNFTRLGDLFGDDVRVLDLQNKQVQVIHPMPLQKGEGVSHPAWSVDGKSLFFSGATAGGAVLLEMNPTGRMRTLLKNRWGWVGFPRPSPDGKRIAYSEGVGESNVTLLEHF